MNKRNQANSRTVVIGSELATKIDDLLLQLSGSSDAQTSHGPLTLEILINMLLEDVEMTASRPGSWEATNMATLLAAHGYCED